MKRRSMGGIKIIIFVITPLGLLFFQYRSTSFGYFLHSIQPLVGPSFLSSQLLLLSFCINVDVVVAVANVVVVLSFFICISSIASFSTAAALPSPSPQQHPLQSSTSSTPSLSLDDSPVFVTILLSEFLRNKLRE